MRGHWEFYVCPVENYLASIALDIGIGEELPLDGYPWLVAVSVKLQDPVDGGFTSPEEYPVLCDMEEELTKALCGTLGGIEVGRVTGGGTRDFLFYLPKVTPVAAAVEEAMKAFPHEYKIHQQEEPQWPTYWEFLYPTTWQKEMIRNRHLVEKMLESGDVPTMVRPVDYYVGLKNEEDAMTFQEEILKSGEEWKSAEINNRMEGDFPWQVHVVCLQAADLITVNQRSGRVFETVFKVNGEYEGWGSVICNAETDSEEI